MPGSTSEETLRALFAEWVASVAGGRRCASGRRRRPRRGCAARLVRVRRAGRLAGRPAFEGSGGASRFWLRVPSAPPRPRGAQAARAPQRPERRRRRRGARRRAATSPADAAAALRGSTARAAGSSGAASVAGAEIVDDYAHHPTEVAAAIDAAPRPVAGARRRLLPAAPLLADRRARGPVRRGAGRRGRGRRHRDLPRPRAARRGRDGEARGRRPGRAAAGHAARLRAHARGGGRLPSRARARGGHDAHRRRGRRAPGGRPAARVARHRRVPAVGRGGLPDRPADDGRHRRAGAMVRAADDRRRAGRGARLGGGGGPRDRRDRAGVEPARCRRGLRRRRASGWPASWPGSSATASASSAAAAPRWRRS